MSEKEKIEISFSMNASERLAKEIEFTDSEYKKVVGSFLLKKFETDEQLKMNYFEKKITLDQIWDSIIEVAKKKAVKNATVMSDEEVYGLAIHFIQDGEIKEIKTNSYVLTKESQEVLQKRAEEEYVAEQKKKLEEAEKKRIEKENRKTNIGLKKVFEILTPQIEQTGEFQLVIPKRQHDLVCWGNELHCCVGTMGYGKRMAQGETIILGVFLNEKIIECCEIGIDYNNKMSVLQLRGDHNLDSPYHSKAEKLINHFLANYKNQKLIGNCI